MRKAGTRNCVMMLDEVDKLGAGGFHGDPSSALLEVLDPEQNSTFRDNYLAVPFDLSQRDVHLHGERARHDPRAAARPHGDHPAAGLHARRRSSQIARRYLVRAPARGQRPDAEQCEISDDALRAIIDDYTREAGVRNLEREIGACCATSRCASPRAARTQVKIDADDLHAILGPRKFEAEVAMRTGVPGVATGLAWTPVGGDILFIEATRMPGSGKLILTGQLGDVMKESAQAALSLVKARAAAARHRRRSCSRRPTSTSTCRRARRRRTGRARASRCSSRSRRCSPSGRCAATSR